MIKRRVFYSFHYAADSWRAATVRNIGVVEGNRPATDNGWESVVRGGDAAVRRWIDDQMKGRSCTVVLVGAHTARRRWIDYEIKKSWEEGKGLAGIHVHELLDQHREQAAMGLNPFDHFTVGGRRLSSIVKCHNPGGFFSDASYQWIRDNLSSVVEEAIAIRGQYG